LGRGEERERTPRLRRDEMTNVESDLKLRAKQLRNNLTEAERCLWSKIRMRQLEGYRFYRQKVIGNYIADFYCHEARLVIEVDGSQHYSDEGAGNDRQRDDFIRGSGVKVLRFKNDEVIQNTTGVVERIWGELKNNPSR
jgi:very-short-patch-repair endonuclease